MNLTLDRFLYGILGAFLGACLGLCICWDSLHGINIKAIIIISVVSFIVSFFWWEKIIKFLIKLSWTDGFKK
jgi:hypothetical protein